MQNIETGYKPEFGLGAWFAGENAANTEAANEEELIKSFLANQRERQMQPIDVEKAQLGLDPARYESQLAQAKSRNPNYIPEQLRGQIGQMQTQAAAGEKAKTLLPFSINAERGTLENTAEDNSLMQQFKQIDGLIRQGGDVDPSSGLLVKFSPQQQQAAVQHRDSLMKSMMSTPKFAQDTMLADSKYEAALTKQQMMNEAALERARLAAEAKIKSLEDKLGEPTKYNLEQAAVADIKQRVEAGIITPAQATKEYADLIAGKQKVNPNPGMVLGRDAEGNIVMDQGSTIPTWKPSVSQQTQAPVTQQEFDTKWKSLKSGESLVGPDGKSYRKK
jgi:hypothetical protein